ncbi:ATP-binding cassette domain-containing protein [Williamsia deligens]|uniref:ATP-binding cassette domain-containing protein n=1 Tax=Williamsia deligens TaxID=321325 RepID=A0ABW3GAR1_9NOCA|nr:ATP-binding cassette domain-containing protein [Williamsia deligens]MCP2196189.1 ABC-2 type transport system ATP-binding protein [Williamsia deligens]
MTTLSRDAESADRVPTMPRGGRHARPEPDDATTGAPHAGDTVDARDIRDIGWTPPLHPRREDSPRATSGATASAAVDVAGLTKEYSGRRVVDEVDFSVPAGTVCGLLGPNGAGKTTTVRMLATLLRPTAGRVTVLGRDVVADATAVRSLIALTGQYASVDEDLTGLENLEIFGRLLGLRGAQARQRSRELVDQFGLTEAGGRAIGSYSGGMRRRLDLAASMIRRPALLFLDEPTTGLDPRTRTQLWEIVRSVVASGTTVVLTTQYLDEADALADQLVVIDHGRVVGRGTPESLKRSVGDFSLSIRLIDPRQADDAAAVMRSLLRAPIDVDVRTGQLTGPVPDSARAAEVIAALTAGRITVGEFGVHTPSLDDVFLALTDDRRPA